MTSGGARILKVTAALLIALAAAPAQAWDIAELMAALGKRQPGEARFVERKYLKILTRPLESSGVLAYVPPNRLVKKTETPKVESLIVEDDRLTIDTPRWRRELRLREYPVVWAFIESIRATLKGDAAVLARFYQSELTGPREDWRLTLKPIQRDMQAVIKEIVIAGREDRVGSVETLEADGDRSVLTVSEGGR